MAHSVCQWTNDNGGVCACAHVRVYVCFNLACWGGKFYFMNTNSVLLNSYLENSKN